MITIGAKAGWCDGCNRATESVELIIYGSSKNSRTVRLCQHCWNEMMETLKEIQETKQEGSEANEK